MSDIIAKRVYISGKVQGVWYRAWTLEQAKKLGLRGYVKNLSDGRVEAVFVGDSASVETLILSCREGPEYAIVEDVSVCPYEIVEDFKSFVIEQ